MTTELMTVDKEQALTVPERAKTIMISSNEDIMAGEEFLTTCKALENQVHSDLDDVVKNAHTSWKSAVALRDKYLTPLEEGRRIVKSKMISYQDEQERIRREAQRIANEEARKRAEDEALALAAQVEAEGDTATAEAILEQPVYVPPVVIPKTVPAASRLSAGRSMWSAEVINLMLLVKAVADGKQPITLLQENATALNSMAKALKSSMAIPGVKAVEKRG